MRESRLYLSMAKKCASFVSHRRIAAQPYACTPRNPLDFIDRATASTPWLSGAIRKQKAQYRATKGRELDLKRAWWTPPLSAKQAWDLETSQIENTLGMDALVSISDHDNIHAGINLHALDQMRDCPISIGRMDDSFFAAPSSISGCTTCR